MPLSAYEASVAVFVRAFANLAALLDKAAAYAARHGLAPATLIGVRHGSMRQAAAVDATATGDRAHGPEPQRRARGGAGVRPDR
jgi:hypothetical protein